MATMKVVLVQVETEPGELAEALKGVLAQFVPQRAVAMTLVDSGDVQSGAALRLEAAAPLRPIKPRKKYQRRQKAAAETPSSGPRAKRDEERDESSPAERGSGAKPKKFELVIDLLKKYGKLSTQEVAMKLAESEQAINRSIGHSKGKIVWDDDADKWKLAGQH